VKNCTTCANYGTQRKWGVVIGSRCNGDPTTRKWGISTALTESRCGTTFKWYQEQRKEAK
jgi:hypothetical protein